MRRIPFLLVNLSGVAAFAMPFLLGVSARPSDQARANDAPWLLAILAPMLVAVAISEAGRRTLSSRSIALLGALTACTALMRLPVSFAGASLFFFLPIACGFVFGSSFGFLLGSLGMAASALISGGIGPWLPFQMWAAGWVGAGAGLAGLLVGGHRTAYVRVAMLSAYAFAAAFFFGACMNLYFWPVTFLGGGPLGWRPGLGPAATLEHYASFYAVTSLGWDAAGGAANLALMLILGKPVLELFSRYRARFDSVVEHKARDSPGSFSLKQDRRT